MANPQRKTVTQMLLALRTNLDEATASFWSDARLIAYLDQAQHMVWSDVRKLKADYFAISRAATDGSVTILGESYDTAGLAIAAATSPYTPWSITLPPDVAEVHVVECLTAGYQHVQFIFADHESPEVRALRQDTMEFGGQAPSVFYISLFGERVLTGSPGSSVALTLRVTYTPILDTLATGTDTLQMPHPLWLAVVDYASARALQMDASPNFVMWERSAQAHIARCFGGHARQTMTPVVVRGLFE